MISTITPINTEPTRPVRNSRRGFVTRSITAQPRREPLERLHQRLPVECPLRENARQPQVLRARSPSGTTRSAGRCPPRRHARRHRHDRGQWQTSASPARTTAHPARRGFPSPSPSRSRHAPRAATPRTSARWSPRRPHRDCRRPAVVRSVSTSSPVRPVHDLDALGGQFLADAIGLREILRLARRNPRRNRVVDRAAPPKHRPAPTSSGSACSRPSSAPAASICPFMRGQSCGSALFASVASADSSASAIRRVEIIAQRRHHAIRHAGISAPRHPSSAATHCRAGPASPCSASAATSVKSSGWR